MTDERHGRISDRERLWTPWRMRYIASSGAREEGCVFCNALARENDVESLILHRGEHAFVIMNLFPYNSGHIMILPNEHVDDPTKLDAATLHEMADLMPICVRALRRVYANQGFNIGYNVGSAAGAGIAEHLHQHIVPRWNGDANFMPVLASTIAMPELLPASYAKIRAELRREMRNTSLVWALMLVDDDRSVLLTDDLRPGMEGQRMIPKVIAEPDQPLWRAAITPFQGWVDDIEVAGYGGKSSVLGGFENVIMLRGQIRSELPESWSINPIETTRFVSRYRSMIHRALGNLAPRIGPPSDPETT